VPHSSRGPGHRPLKAEIIGSNPICGTTLEIGRDSLRTAGLTSAASGVETRVHLWEACRIVSSLLAGWRVSLRRTRADLPVVAAAWLIVLLSATLFAAGPMYSSAASLAGLRRTLADASVADTTIEVSDYRSSSQLADADRAVRDSLTRAVAPLAGPVIRSERLSATLDLTGVASARPGDQALLGSLDGLPDHARLVAGTWPSAGPGTSEAVDVVVVAAVATELGLHVGDAVPLVGHRFGEPFSVAARVVGIVVVRNPSDPYWYGDEQLTTGISTSGVDRTFGPFLATPEALARVAAGDSIHVAWRAFPTFDQLTVDAVPFLRAKLEALPGRIEGSIGDGAFVATGLATLLGDAEQSLLVSRTEVLLLMLQLAIMAGYAILLTGSLLGEHRRLDTELLRSRGAGAIQVAWLALGEGLLVALPAVLLAPWLALVALNAFDVVGPLADAGLGLAPAVSLDAYAYAAAAGLVCVGLLVIPAALAARGYAAEQRDVSRQETRTLGQRLGLDVALVAVTGIAIWQLRLYGAPLTRDIHGTLGLDPLLVAAPAVGLLAGGIVALRVLPRLARVGESAAARGRSLVGSLGARQLARRPLRYTRSALLVMLALSMGVFGLSYAATWTTSQQDQAAYQSGAEVRVTPSRSVYGLPAWSLPAAYMALPGIGQLSAVERDSGGVKVGGTSADLLAIDAGAASDVVLFRPDEAATSLGDLMRPLRDGRPQVPLVSLSGEATALRIKAHVDLGSIIDLGSGPIIIGSDGLPEQPKPKVLDPAAADLRVGADAIVRDARGLLYQVQAAPVLVTGPDTEVVLSLEPASGEGQALAAQAGSRLDGPIELAALGIQISLASRAIATSGTIGIAGVSSGPSMDGPWADVALTPAGVWDAEIAQSRGFVPVPSGQVTGLAIELSGQGEVGSLFGGTSARLAFSPHAIATALEAPVSAVANRAFLAGAAANVGDTIVATVAGAAREVTITGVVDAFPTTDPARPLLVFDEPTLGLLRLDASSTARNADEWWLGATGGGTDALATALQSTPFESSSVITATGRAASLRADPVALGIIGALLLGALATGLFSVVGLTVSAAVAARQRRTEFALLRALGLSGPQLSGWLWLENGSLVVVSLIAGTVLGLLIGWLVLPVVTVTQQATAPIPSAIVRVPWDQIAVLVIASAVALGVAVIVIGGALRRIGVGGVLRMGED
jgi:hypothetical protein